MTSLFVLTLLVLASLAPAAIPALAWVPAPAPEQHVPHVGLDHAPHAADVAPAGHDRDCPTHPTGGHRDASPALACCVVMHCPMLTGGLSGAPAQPSPPAGSPASEAAVPGRLAGLSIPPALPPPRAA